MGKLPKLFTNVSFGSYAVTVKDAVNCSFATNIVITQPTPLASTISGVNPTTLGGSDGSATELLLEVLRHTDVLVVVMVLHQQLLIVLRLEHTE